MENQEQEINENQNYGYTNQNIEIMMKIFHIQNNGKWKHGIPKQVGQNNPNLNARYSQQQEDNE